MKHTSNFNSKFLTFWLNTAGIGLVSQKYAKYINLFKYYLIYSFILLTSGQILLLGRLNTIQEITITLVFINCGFFLNSTTLILHLKKTYIMNLFESIDAEFVELPLAYDVTPGSVRFKLFFFKFGLSGIILYVLSISSTVIFFPFSNKSYDDISALFIPGAFPWTINTIQTYLMTITLQFSWLLALSVPVALNFLFGIYYMIEIRVQYDVLCKSIERVTHSKEWLALSERYDEQMELKLLALFNSCIQHHQKIRKFSNNFNGCYNTAFSANLFYSVPTLALILLSVAEEKSLASISRNVMTLAMIVIYLWLYTSIGQTILNANEHFRYALLRMPWYENKSIKFRKTLLIVLCSTERILNLKASNKYVASYILFGDILRLSYSYYNIIDQTFGH